MESESKENNAEDTRQAKREEKLRKAKARIKKHGKGTARDWERYTGTPSIRGRRGEGIQKNEFLVNYFYIRMI